jgi:multisubunit Na+/H+ antiporter MnhE subunit
MPALLQLTNLAYLLAAYTSWMLHDYSVSCSSLVYGLAFTASVLYHHRPYSDITHQLDYSCALACMAWHFWVVVTMPWNRVMAVAVFVCFGSLAILARDKDEDMGWWHCGW